KKKNKKQFKLTPTQMIALTFAIIILLGAVLLSLPVASRSGVSCGFRPALFTATSATCVTGLVMFDTWTQWSAFGQVVILCLIEIGGLGFMSATSLVIMLLRKKIGLRQKMLIAQAFSVNEMESVVSIQKWVIFGSLIIQLSGALVLFFRFLPQRGVWGAFTWSIFHAVSAFCNAGFDIVGSVSPGTSVMIFNQDPVVMITLMFLVVVGGLGFFVWQEIATVKGFKNYSVYTKLVLITSGVLLVGGALIIGLLEWNNPETLGAMDTPTKILNAFFQSVTLRTAGFAAIDQAALTESSKAFSIVLMLIGGSSGSTAGGIKTITVLVLILFVFARARGRETVTVFRRTIPQAKIMDAATIVSLVVGLAMIGAIVITATSPVSFVDALYETGSAMATVGLTAGVTPLLSIPAQYMIILFMYFGRVGILTLSLGFLAGDKAEDRFRYADTNLLIG
ncbi:MAG: potassium uptake protein, TrkH family, partial [Oscillospiraceae bacterium]|nr:potassium uptake protein, TrkH family [Oscillospiraceae bacterium]